MSEYCQSLSCFLSIAAFADDIWGAERSDAGLEKSLWHGKRDKWNNPSSPDRIQPAPTELEWGGRSRDFCD